MKKNLQLSPELISKLKSYTAAAGAVLAVGQVANSQNIQYTDVNPDVTLTAFPDSFLIDFDNDGVNDINMNLSKVVGSSYFAWFMKASPVGSATSVVSSASYVANLNAGDTIKPINAFVNSGYGLALYSNWLYNGGMYPYGNWGGQVDSGYVGVKFDISGTTHYGWIRCSTVNSDSTFSVTIHDFAYDTRADMPIVAGDTSVGITVNANELTAEKFNLYPNPSNGKFKIEMTENNVFVTVTDITGKTVFAENVTSDSWIDLTNQPKGTYLVQIKSENGLRNEKIIIE